MVKLARCLSAWLRWAVDYAHWASVAVFRSVARACIAFGLWIAIAIIIVVPTITLSTQIIGWLALGVWRREPASAFFPLEQIAYSTHWLGVRRIILDVGHLNIAVWAIVVGVPAALILKVMGEAMDGFNPVEDFPKLAAYLRKDDRDSGRSH